MCRNVFVQISKCLGKNFQPNGYGVDANDLAEKMQQLTAVVSTSLDLVSVFKLCGFLFAVKVSLFSEV